MKLTKERLLFQVSAIPQDKLPTGMITGECGAISAILRQAMSEGRRISPEAAETLWTEKDAIEYAWRQDYNDPEVKRTATAWAHSLDHLKDKESIRSHMAKEWPFPGYGSFDDGAQMTGAQFFSAFGASVPKTIVIKTTEVETA